MKNEKFFQAAIGGFLGFFAIVLVAAFCVCASGCKTASIDSTGVGERNQFISGQLDSTIKSLDRALVECDGEVRDCLERSRGIESGAERLKYLIGEYFKIVERIQDANNRAIAELEGLEKGMHDGVHDSNGTDTHSGSGSVSGTDEKD